MKGLAVFLLITLAYPLTVSAGGLPLPPPDPSKGVIAVTLRGKPPVGPRISAVQVYFVRIDEGEDPLQADEVRFSDFSGKRQVYLLNCEPGRYVAVGAELTSRGTGMKYKVFLDQPSIAETEVAVAPGEVAFMGVVLTDLRVKIAQADDAQAHFLGLFEPEIASRGYTARALSGSALYLGSLVEMDRSLEAERRFLTVGAKKVFRKHPEWRKWIEDRLTEGRAER